MRILGSYKTDFNHTIEKGIQFYSYSCNGFRSLNLKNDTYLRELKVNSSFSYNSGYKRFENQTVVTESEPPNQLPTYKFVDDTNTTNMPPSSNTTLS